MVSIIVPAYNAELTIVECVNSLLAQTYPFFEIIVIDDYSKDKTIEVLESNFANNEKIRFFSNSKNEGPGQSRNNGIAKARGEWIAFCDADDTYEENYLEVIFNKKDVDDECVICNFRYVTSKMKYIYPSNISVLDNSKNSAIAASGFSLCRTVTKIHLWDDLLIPQLYNYEDASIIPILIDRAKKISIIDDVLYNYRLRKGSASINRPTKRTFNNSLEAFSFIESNLPNNYHEEIEFLGIQMVIYASTIIGLKAKIKIKELKKHIDIFRNKYPLALANKYYKNLSNRKRFFIKRAFNKKIFLLKVYASLHHIYRTMIAR